MPVPSAEKRSAGHQKSGTRPSGSCSAICVRASSCSARSIASVRSPGSLPSSRGMKYSPCEVCVRCSDSERASDADTAAIGGDAADAACASSSYSSFSSSGMSTAFAESSGDGEGSAAYAKGGADGPPRSRAPSGPGGGRSSGMPSPAASGGGDGGGRSISIAARACLPACRRRRARADDGDITAGEIVRVRGLISVQAVGRGGRSVKGGTVVTSGGGGASRQRMRLRSILVLHERLIIITIVAPVRSEGRDERCERECSADGRGVGPSRGGGTAHQGVVRLVKGCG